MWGAATHDRSTGVHRPLTATVLALRPLVPDGTGDAQGSDVDDTVLLISLDHCIIADADLADIRARAAAAAQASPERVHITLSHTHGAGLLMRDRAELPGGEDAEQTDRAVAHDRDGLAGPGLGCDGGEPAGPEHV